MVVVCIFAVFDVEDDDVVDLNVVEFINSNAPTPTTAPTATGIPYRCKMRLTRAKTPSLIGFNCWMFVGATASLKFISSMRIASCALAASGVSGFFTLVLGKDAVLSADEEDESDVDDPVCDFKLFLVL